VTIMPTEPAANQAAAAATHADLTVRVDLRRLDLAGQLIVGGRPATTFRGWAGLLAALDQALDTLRPDGPETRGA